MWVLPLPITLCKVKESADDFALQAIILSKRISVLACSNAISTCKAIDCMEEFKFVPKSTVIVSHLSYDCPGGTFKGTVCTEVSPWVSVQSLKEKIPESSLCPLVT